MKITVRVAFRVREELTASQRAAFERFAGHVVKTMDYPSAVARRGEFVHEYSYAHTTLLHDSLVEAIDAELDLGADAVSTLAILPPDASPSVPWRVIDVSASAVDEMR